MSIIVAPSRQYEATLEVGVTGLGGTLKLGTYDGDTATQALSAANIDEIGTTGVYVATRTSPSTSGQYVLVWSLDGTLDPEQVSTEDLVVTSDTPARSSLTVESLANYEASLEVGISGLVGTIEMGVYEGDIAVDALSASNINEIGTTGIYVATRTAPEDTGQYVIIWSLDGTLDPEQVSTEDLRVVASGDVSAEDAYATVEELARILKIRTPSDDQENAMERVLVAATGEINSEIDLAEEAELSGWQLALAAEVCLRRAAELWKLEEVQFGIVGLGSEFGATHIARNTWDKYAFDLAPLKSQFGIA